MIENLNLTKYAAEMVRTTELAEVITFLKQKFPVRRIDEVVNTEIGIKAKSLGIPVDEMKDILRARLGSENEENLDNWITPGAVDSIERVSAIKIAFALQMNVVDAEAFLGRCWHSAFYPRDVKDVIYRYGLDMGWNFDEAQRLATVFANLDQPNIDPISKDDEMYDDLTDFLRNEYDRLKGVDFSEDRLKAYITENKEFFGSFRRKAYERFDEYYSALRQGWGATDDGKRVKPLTTNQICDLIVKSIPAMRKKKTKTFLSKLISENVPARTTLAEVRSKYERSGRVTQVDKKLLILAWLTSEDGEILEFDEGDEEAAFEDHRDMLDDLMGYCGMPALDYRHPFDWIVMNALFCAYSPDIDFDAEERLQDLIDRLLDEE